MKPKYRFVLNTVFFGLGAFLVFSLTVFAVSFIAFILRGRGAWFLPGFGWPGIKIFIISFPWILVLAVIIFLAILEILVKHFGFAYRRPLIYSVLGVVIVISVVGVYIDSTPLHTNALRSAAKSNLPIAGPLYMNYGLAPIDNIYEGVVSDITDETDFLIEAPDGKSYNIAMPTSTDVKIIKNGKIQKDDRVMIIGEKDGSNIKAFGIQKLEINEEPLFHQMQRNMRQKNENQPSSTTKNQKYDEINRNEKDNDKTNKENN